MAIDLGPLFISSSYQNLVQRSASGAFNILTDGTGSVFIPVSSSYAISSSYAVSASRADSALSASHADSASFAPAGNLQEVLTAGNSASIAINLTASLNTTASVTEHKNEFKVTAQDKDSEFDINNFIVKNNSGKTKISGSVDITGSVDIAGDIVTGDKTNVNNANKINMAIIGGENNTIQSTANYGGIFGATRGTIENSDASSLFGGFFNTVRGTYNGIIGGTRNDIENGTSTHFGNVIVGGQFNKIPTNVSRSVVLGGTQITASASDTVFMPAFKANGSSTIGDVNGASVNVDIGSGTNPNRYGNFQINQNTTTHTGNYYSAFQIIDSGTGGAAQLANSAFTGLGNNIQFIGLGANSTGRSDAIKLWATGSEEKLHVAENIKLGDGLDIEMSGSLNLAGLGTGSNGQVVSVDASGIAKWADASADPFPFTGSAQITGSLAVTGSTILSQSVAGDESYALETLGNARVRKNVSGENATLVIQDDAQLSYTDGPTLQFSGSNTGLIKSAPATNMRFDFERDFIFNIGDGGTGAQFSINLANNQSGDFRISDAGHRDARYEHENLTNTGSIRFANTTEDVGIGLRMDDDQMALQMYSGSAFVPIIRRPSGSRQISIYDSTFSTGSSGQALTSNANGGIEWGAASAFPHTGSAQITGSLIVTGSVNLGNFNDYNTLGTSINALIHGDGNSIASGEDIVVLGGEGNSTGGGVGYSGIYSAAASSLSNTDTSVIVGGYQNQLQAARSFIIAGNDNRVTDSGATFSGIIGGQGHRISSAITASAIIGGRNFTATQGDTVYVPKIEAFQGGANITGSILAKNGAVFGESGDSSNVDIGKSGAPNRYGNFQITQDTVTHTGNYYSAFQINDAGAGGGQTQLANSAFTGLGNNIQYLALGANTSGRSDAIKLWASGSSDELHFASTASFDASEINMANLPTAEPSNIGQLWLSGSAGSNSKYLVVKTS